MEREGGRKNPSDGFFSILGRDRSCEWGRVSRNSSCRESSDRRSRNFALPWKKKKGKGKEIAMNEIFTRNRLVTCTYTMRSCINLAWRVSFIPSRKQVAVVPRKFASAVRQSGSLFRILHSVDKLSNELFEGWSRKEREKIRMGRV